MNSIVKIVVLFAILIGVVGGVTYISVKSPEIVDPGQDPGSKKTQKHELNFSSGALLREPDDQLSPANRAFPGFFEYGTTYDARFWFTHSSPTPITMQFLGVDCPACSESALLTLPSDLRRDFENLYAVGTLPFGTFPVSILGSGLGEAQLEARLAPLWVRKKFKDDPNAAFEIPAAPPGGTQTGILELHFTARSSRTLTSLFRSWTADNPQDPKTHKFSVTYEVVPPFEVVGDTYSVGGIDERTPPRIFDVPIISRTREAKDFPPPQLQVFDVNHTPVGDKDIVSVGKPIPLTFEECARLAKAPDRDGQPFRRVLSGYRVPVTVAARGDIEAFDIGQVSRIVRAVIPGGQEGNEKDISVHATIKGGIRLAGGENTVDVGEVRRKEGRTKEFTLFTDSAAIELEPDDALNVPDFLKVTIQKLPSEGETGEFKATVTVPPDHLFGPLPTNSVVVFKIKGEKPRRVRIPITGRGSLN